MAVTVQDLRDGADQLLDALNVYDRFADGWPYDSGSVPTEVDTYLAERDERVRESNTQTGVTLAAEVADLYYEAREVESAYVQQVRECGREDWPRVVAETKPTREATRQVHVAGCGTNPETGELGYVLPEELCPAYLVSMNAGSSPITYEDRVAQYRAVADRFDLTPEIVYHPGSGHDVSLSAAFPDSQVVYIDVDATAMADLERAGYEGHAADATGYELADGADVIVFRNAGLFEEAVVAANLRAGGWVLANDHLESARHVARLDSFQLVGIVSDKWSGERPSVETGRVAGNPRSVPQFERWSPLDLYVFRNEG